MGDEWLWAHRRHCHRNACSALDSKRRHQPNSARGRRMRRKWYGSRAPARGLDHRKPAETPRLNCGQRLRNLILLVSLAWTFALMDPGVAVSATYCAFNLCLMIVCLRIVALHPRATLQTIAFAIAASAAIQAASIVLSRDHSVQLWSCRTVTLSCRHLVPLSSLVRGQVPLSAAAVSVRYHAPGTPVHFPLAPACGARNPGQHE